MFVITFIQICVRQIHIDKQCVRYWQFIKHVNAIKPVFNCAIKHTITVGLPYRAINTDHDLKCLFLYCSVVILRYSDSWHMLLCLYRYVWEAYTDFQHVNDTVVFFCLISIRLFICWHCLHTAQYAAQGLWNVRASVPLSFRLSVPSIDSSSSLRQVCCWAPRG